MAARYIICGQVGAGTDIDPFRPECVAAFPPRTSWAASQESPELPRFIVSAALTDAQFAALTWHAVSNPLGFHWMTVDAAGVVTIHAAP